MPLLAAREPERVEPIADPPSTQPLPTLSPLDEPTLEDVLQAIIRRFERARDVFQQAVAHG